MPEEKSGPRRRTSPFLVFGGRTGDFAFEAARVRRVLDPAEHDLAHARDLRTELELPREPESARVLSVDVGGALWFFVVSAPLRVVDQGDGELVELPALVQARGAGRFLGGALVDGQRLISLVLDPARLVAGGDARRGAASEEEEGP